MLYYSVLSLSSTPLSSIIPYKTYTVNEGSL